MIRPGKDKRIPVRWICLHRLNIYIIIRMPRVQVHTERGI